MAHCYLPEVFNYLQQEVSPRRPDYFYELETFAIENKIPIIGPETGAFLELLVKLLSPRNILEVGTATGYSALWLARSFKGRGRITTIEFSSPNSAVAAENFKKYDRHKKIELITGDAFKLLPVGRQKYKLIFIDAVKKDYSRYLERCLPLLNKKGMIVFDNLFWHGQVVGVAQKNERFQKAVPALQKFNKEFVNTPQLSSLILPIGDGLGLGIKR